MVYLLLLGNILLMVLGQILWKIGLDKIGGLSLQTFWQVMFSSYILIGAALYAVATLLWLAVLSRLPLSVAYPLQSLAYVAAMLLAVILFQETVPLNRWIGAGIILVGIIFLSWD